MKIGRKPLKKRSGVLQRVFYRNTESIISLLIVVFYFLEKLVSLLLS